MTGLSRITKGGESMLCRWTEEYRGMKARRRFEASRLSILNTNCHCRNESIEQTQPVHQPGRAWLRQRDRLSQNQRNGESVDPRRLLGPNFAQGGLFPWRAA